MTELTITKPDDFHLHLRQGDLMKQLVPITAESFARVLVMPNLVPPVVTAEDLNQYREDLQSCGTDLDFIMVFKTMPSTTPDMVAELKAAGATAGKLYPQGVSVNSDDGVTEVEELYPLFSAMQEQDLVLCIHGETPGVDDMHAEEDFLPTFKAIHENFPQLRMVLEHTSTKAGIEMVKEMPDNIASTITIQHMLLTIDDVRHDHHVDHPHHYCRPVCKTEADRKAIQEVVLSGHPKFFFGSDSAPHLRETKEVTDREPARGVFSTPVAIPLLAQFFEEHDKLDLLEPYTSQLGANFYQLEKNTSTITVKKEPWTVPDEYAGVVSIAAGQTLPWSVS